MDSWAKLSSSKVRSGWTSNVKQETDMFFASSTIYPKEDNRENQICSDESAPLPQKDLASFPQKDPSIPTQQLQESEQLKPMAETLNYTMIWYHMHRMMKREQKRDRTVQKRLLFFDLANLHLSSDISLTSLNWSLQKKIHWPPIQP